MVCMTTMLIIIKVTITDAYLRQRTIEAEKGTDLSCYKGITHASHPDDNYKISKSMTGEDISDHHVTLTTVYCSTELCLTSRDLLYFYYGQVFEAALRR
jgi:hypothetical protein